MLLRLRRLQTTTNSIATAKFLSPGHHKTLTTSSATTTTTKKDAYFALINHITNIVKRDLYPERTLNKLNLQITSELVYRVLRACAQSPHESLRFFHWARGHYAPTSLEHEELIKTLAHHKLYSSMWKLITQLRTRDGTHFCLSPETVCYIVEEYGRHGLVDHSVEIFNKCTAALNCPQGVEVHNSLLFSLCEVRLFHAAYALVRRMIRKGSVPNKRTYTVLVNAWCQNGKLKEAEAFLREMSDKGFNPPVRGRDLLVEGLLNAGSLESAKDMVRKMVKESVVPDVGMVNSLLEVACKVGEVDFCVDMWHSLCKLGFVPDVNSFKVLIPAVSKVGRIDEAFSLLYNAVEDGHRPFPSLYAPIIKGLCRLGRFDDAFCFFAEMKVKGHPPNRPVYTMLITMCGRGGKYVEAANYLVEMTEVGLVPISRCFDLVTDGLKNHGKHDLAKRIAQLEVSLCRI